MTAESSNWDAVDSLLTDHLLRTTNSQVDFDWILDANEAADLPAIDVSPLQGKLLHLLVRISGARRVLEIGTLGGYSTAWMASALPSDGEITTIEMDARHAGMAAANLQEAGLADRVRMRLGRAANILDELIRDGIAPFDLVFIDADKPSGEAYFQAALKLTKSGSTIICDNVVRGGGILESESEDPDVIGTQKLLAAISGASSVDASAIQTVGKKGHDGFAIAVVR